ncbi:MAG: hypothetical protein IJE05_02560 [Clostridia bacterium]|nr:hypothetical protein [Clostridia bacterium]
MKKLLAIIGVLLVIFIGMYIYKSNINQTTITVSEVEKIEEYISKIYMWQEITEEALPKFDNINNAPDLWVWEVVKKNLDNYELSYNEIQDESIEIFGENFKKQFPKEGSEFIYYDENEGKYLTTGIGLNAQEDMFLIKEINKNKNGYEVEIVEYVEDYQNAIELEDEEQIYDIYIKNLNQDIIATIKSTQSETKTIELVKQNIDKFSTKTVNLVTDAEGKIYIESVK